MKRLPKMILGATVGALMLTGCVSAADKASENTSTAADNFEVQRRIWGYNNVTDTLIFEIEGRCSIEIRDNGILVSICKHGPDDFRKHYLGASDQTTWISEQMEGIDVSEYNTRIILRPETIIPTIELDTSSEG